ncbi:MAG: hypothetical protein GF331_04085 [Chitinivibrionales bacterium]|nr:hypothetical protein [Chitinivibrionales bacterium]
MPIALRIIRDTPHSAPFNMAADLHLLQTCGRGETVYLRLYRWQRPSVTLGWMENARQVLDLDALTAADGEWVRRPTGGRAVLHHGDLTYSVAFSRRLESMGHTIAASYRVLSECLANGLRRVGVAGSTHDSSLDVGLVRREGKLPCFLAPNRDELMVDGRKLVGSAQKRSADAVLQHGSIPITTAFRSLPDYLRLEPEQRKTYRRMLERKCTCIAELAPSVTAETLGRHVADGFIETLHARAEERPWSPDEVAQIERLAQSPAFLRTYLSPDRTESTACSP